MQIALDKGAPAHRLAMPARQVVVHHRSMTGVGERLAGVAADVARPARGKDRLWHPALTAQASQILEITEITPSSSITWGCVSSPRRAAVGITAPRRRSGLQ